jgi:hypothetical protein
MVRLRPHRLITDIPEYQQVPRHYGRHSVVSPCHLVYRSITGQQNLNDLKMEPHIFGPGWRAQKRGGLSRLGWGSNARRGSFDRQCRGTRMARAVVCDPKRRAINEPLYDVDQRTGATVEVFYADGVLARSFGASGPGWFCWTCRPGCLPEEMPAGPFATSYGAYRDVMTCRRLP